MKVLHNNYFQLVVRLIMGGLFLYAGLGKIRTPIDFASQIYNYKLLPNQMIGLLAVILPWLEVLAGACLLLGLNAKGGAFTISGLLALFIAVLFISAVRGLDVECGCFSGIERRVGLLAIFEDMAMLSGGLFLLFFDRVVLSPYKFIISPLKSRKGLAHIYRNLICMIGLSLIISIGTAVRSTNLAFAGQVNEISAQELSSLITSSQDLVIIDVSTSGEYKEGHIKGSLFGDMRLFRTRPEEYLNSLGVDKSEKIILVCETGMKSRRMAETLLETGYPNISNLTGGKLDWVRRGFELISGEK